MITFARMRGSFALNTKYSGDASVSPRFAAVLAAVPGIHIGLNGLYLLASALFNWHPHAIIRPGWSNIAPSLAVASVWLTTSVLLWRRKVLGVYLGLGLVAFIGILQIILGVVNFETIQNIIIAIAIVFAWADLRRASAGPAS